MTLRGVRESLVRGGLAVILLGCLLPRMQAAAQTREPLPREKFSFDLPKLTYSIDNETREFSGVRITLPGDDDQVFIGIYNDTYTKISGRGSTKTVYRESPEKAERVTRFEAKYIAEVNGYFIESLEVFEKLLQKSAWARCLYFDSFFPHFLDGYYYLISAARNSQNTLSMRAKVPDEQYDVSLNSLKSDARINQWQSSAESVIKLRIASKELARQLRLLQKDLEKMTDQESLDMNDVEGALSVFVKVYFNLKPQARASYR
ncbi:MAG: hypothetical protein MUF22_09095 [Chitinispirillaceae bacterium]|jgi:hypothetical protein|nr:hypothetical protein [Chitinispirillaceae bacterium]